MAQAPGRPGRRPHQAGHRPDLCPGAHRRRRALIQLSSSLRNLDQAAERDRQSDAPDDAASAFLALADTGRERNAATVMAATTTTVTAIAAPPRRNRPLSSAAWSLKCDGTPRACCSETQATSRLVEVHSRIEAAQPVARRTGSQAATQPSVSVVRPNETPKVTGLRHDSGPAADPPATAQAAAWASPAAISTRATR